VSAGCCAERGRRPRKRVASRRAPLKTLLVIALYRPHIPGTRIGKAGGAGAALANYSGYLDKMLIAIKDRLQRLGVAGRARFGSTEAEKELRRYSRPRTLSRMGHLRAKLGKNSNTRFPPASVAIDDRKVRLTTLAVTLGSG
jgi:hypothetical protein